MAESYYRVFPGIIILLLVALFWVFSAEIASLLVRDEQGERENSSKPSEDYNNAQHGQSTPKTGAYFLTYFKSALFSIYLWIVLSVHLFRNGCFAFGAKEDPMLELSESHFVPLKNADNQYDWDDEDETVDDSLCSGSLAILTETESRSSHKSVRFKNLAEVRHLVKKCEQPNSFGSSGPMGHLSRRYGLREHAYLAVQCVTLWFFANYFYALALRFTEADVTSLLSLTSSIFILLFGVFLPSSPSDRFTITKLVAICLMITGAVLAGIADSSPKATPLGITFALASAFLYSAYLTLIKHKYPSQSVAGVLSLLGFMGLYCLIFFWPAFIVLHAFDLESFQIPNDYNVLILLTTSSLVGSVIADALWLIGAYMTSSLAATLSLSLTMPLTMLADWLIRNVHVTLFQVLPVVPLLAGFLLGVLSSQGDSWDPVFVMLRQLLSPCRTNSARCFIQKARLRLMLKLWPSSAHPTTEDRQACSLLSALDDNDSSAVLS